MARRAWAALCSLLLLGSSLLIGSAPAQAAGLPEYEAAARLLNRYGVVQGDSRGYRFYDQITRAEVAKLLVYSLGMGGQEASHTGRREYTDTTNHWADGVISMARAHNLMRGDGNGTFRPDAPVSYAEAVTAVARLVGIEGSNEPWPHTYIRPAREIGIIPASMSVESRLNQPASRGDVFVMLHAALVDVKNFKGENLLRRYLDRTPPELELDRLPASTEAARVRVTGMVKGADELRVNGSLVEFEEIGGYYAADVSIQVGPNTIRVQAMDAAGHVTTKTAQVERLSGRVTSIQVTGPDAVMAGQSAQFTITLKDSAGRELNDISLVDAYVSDPALGRIDALTGRFTASSKIGSGAITFMAGSAQTSVPISVVGSGLYRIGILPEHPSIAPGESIQFTVQGYDAAGNVLPVSGATWRATGGTIDANGLFQAGISGGTYTVTATASGLTQTITIQPTDLSVASVRLSAPTVMRANGRTEQILTATFLDSAGKQVNDFSGPVTITSTSPSVAAPAQATVMAVNGQALVPVRAGIVPGSAMISVRTVSGRSGSATVRVEAQRIQSVRLEGVSAQSGVGTLIGAVEAVALDQDGNPIRSRLPQSVVIGLTLPPTGTATFLANGERSTDIVLLDLDAATGEVRTRVQVEYFANSGTIMIEGLAKPKEMAYVRVAAGAIAAGQAGMPARLSIDPVRDASANAPQTVWVNVLDSQGLRVTQRGLLENVSISLRDQNGVTWWREAVTAVGTGQVAFTVTQSNAGTYTYTATLHPQGATAWATARTVPGGVHEVKVTSTPSSVPADNTTQATLRAELLDSQGNRVTSPTYSVRFERVSNTGATRDFTERTVYSSNGLAEVTVRAGSVVAAEEFRVTVENAGVQIYQETYFLRTTGAAQRLAMEYGDNNRNNELDAQDYLGRVSNPFTVTVKVLDEGGNLLRHENSRIITLRYLNTATNQSLPPRSARVTNGVATFTETFSAAGTYAIQAEATGLMKALSVGYGGSLPDAQILPSHPVSIRLQADVDRIKPDGGVSYAVIRAQMVDSQGNPTTNQTGLPVTVTLSMPNASYNIGYFSGNDTKDGIKVQSRTVTIQPGQTHSDSVKVFSRSVTGTISVTGQTPDGTAHTQSITVTTAIGAVASLQVSTPAWTQPGPWAAGETPVSGYLVRVTAVDAGNRRVTDLSQMLSVQGLSPDVRVVAYRNQFGEWVTVDTGRISVVSDRGDTEFLVTSDSNSVGALELFVGNDPDAANRIKREITIQF